jgi:hypothetical protein
LAGLPDKDVSRGVDPSLQMGCFDEAQNIFTSGKIGIGVADTADPSREVTASGTAVNTEGLKLLAQPRGFDLQSRTRLRRPRPNKQRHTRQEFTPCHGPQFDSLDSTPGA